MANFTTITNNIVTNVINIEADTVVKSDTAGIGDMYNPETGLFTRPQPIIDQNDQI